MMSRRAIYSGGAACLALAVLTLTGCSAKHGTIADTFPKSGSASPWILNGEVWSGTLEQAAAAIGEDAVAWGAFEPRQVWLAIYRHETRPANELTVRAWEFASVARAQEVYKFFSPGDADSLKAGDDACWTQDGILVLWGRMVFDIFGRGPAALASPEQAVYLLAFIEKGMPADLPENPR